MVDYFALALSHGLMAIAVWRMILRTDLDEDPAEGADGEPPAAPTGPKRFGKPAMVVRPLAKDA